MAEPRRAGLTFLLEIGCEEIPAPMMPRALQDLSRGIMDALGVLARDGSASQELGGPRRLVTQVRGIAPAEVDRDEVVTGPSRRAAFDARGRPTKAAEGFARKQGLSVDKLQITKTPKGEVLCAVRHVRGRTAREVLSAACPEVLGKMRFRKMMRWGDRGYLFVRPVHWIVALLDEEVVPFEFMGVAAGRESRGHRFLGPGPHRIGHAGEYEKVLLERGRIVARHQDRKDAILAAATDAAQAAGGTLRPDEDLLEELTFLTEHPAVVSGAFPEEYLSLPEPVLITAMRHHQKYFTVEDAEGRLRNAFVGVLTTEPDSDGRIRRGNEWVLKARLADARFFQQEDQKVPLEDRVASLAGVTFHARLGSYADKAARMERLLELLVEGMDMPSEQAGGLREAARLCKTDLTTGMVGEFPELQGVIGGIYARMQGHSEVCARAIEEHYRPAGPSDPVPSPGAPSALAVADKMDTLALCFSAGLVPKGSADPYALRRAALGSLRILIENEIPLDLEPVLRAALEQAAPMARRAVEERAARRMSGASLPENPHATLAEFLSQRLRFLMEEDGVRFDAARAAIGAGWSRPLRAWRRARAVNELRGREDFLALAAAAKRVRNILAQAREKGIDFASDSVSDGLLVHDAEKALHQEMTRLSLRASDLAGKEDHGGALSVIAGIRPTVDRFFDDVLVMDRDEKVRRNRLSLLADLSRLLSREADFAEVVVEGE